jgi:hypothetical protein
MVALWDDIGGVVACVTHEFRLHCRQPSLAYLGAVALSLGLDHLADVFGSGECPCDALLCRHGCSSFAWGRVRMVM